jgi:tetratricopeptide (TPR) repeat protein
MTEPFQKTALWSSIGFVRHLAVVFTLGIIVLLTFANTLQNTGFALDNKFIILDDPRLRQANRENLWLIFHQDYWWPKAVSGLYRPLTTLSYLFNYAVLGNATNSAGYHLINFCLHWLNAILVYFMVLVLMEKLWPALFTAAVFATHPIVTESVTNIVGRSDLFATATIVGGVLCYAKSTTKSGWRKLPWLLLLTVITTLGVFFKESAVMVLGVMALYDFTCRLRRLHSNWPVNLLVNFWQFGIKGYIAVLPPLVVLAWVRASVFGQLRPPEFPFVDNPLVSVAAERGGNYYNNSLVCTLTAIKVVGRYLWLLLWPQKLSCDYSYNQIPLVELSFRRFEDWKAILALAVVLGAITVAIRQYRRNKAVFFFIMFFFLTFLPTSNLIIVAGSIMAERFMYLPSIGFAGCVVIVIYAVCRRVIPQWDISRERPIAPQVAACSALSLIVLACGTRAFIRNFDWHDDIALWNSAVKVCPNSFKTHKSLGYALYERYRDKPPSDFADLDHAIEEGKKARAIMEERPLPPLYRTGIVYVHLGAYYRIKGETIALRGQGGALLSAPEALPWYRKSIEALTNAIPPDLAFNDDNRKKELDRGIARDQIPDVGNPEVYSNLGLSYMRLGQYQDARSAFLHMRHLDPTNPDAYQNIATIYILTGEAENAILSFLQTVILDHNRNEVRQLLVDMFRQIDRDGCSVVSSPTQARPALNTDCPLVRNHLCAACLGLTQVFLDARQIALARQTMQSALEHYNCAAEQFQNLLPDSMSATSLKK